MNNKDNKITNLAIIPARGGSKRLKNKNLLKLGGKPLVSHTIEAAIGSKYISNIIVSSDSEEILNIASTYENVEIHRRDETLSSDHSTALELVTYLFAFSKKEYDYISLLLPTCPFRKSLHIDEGFEKIKKNDDGVISVTNYDFPIELKVPVKNNYINLDSNSPLITGNTRSQNHKPNFRPNGGFYISKWKSFEKNKNFWKGRVRFYEMSTLDSVDVDTKLDLTFAEHLINTK